MDIIDNELITALLNAAIFLASLLGVDAVISNYRKYNDRVSMAFIRYRVINKQGQGHLPAYMVIVTALIGAGLTDIWTLYLLAAMTTLNIAIINNNRLIAKHDHTLDRDFSVSYNPEDKVWTTISH